MFKGSIVALATPFTVDEEVDYEALHQLIAWHIEERTDAIVLCGITGEAPTLSAQEQIRIFKEGVLAAQGRIPIIAGTGSCITGQAVSLTKEAKRVGVDGCLVVVPYYNRPTPEGCYEHYQEVDKVGLPMIVYHHPTRCGLKLPVSMLAKISTLPSVVGIKESCDLEFTLEVIRTSSQPILSGDDIFTLPLMASGAVGVISVVANVIPAQWHRFTHLLASHHLEEARALFNQYYSLAKAMMLETNPQCVKYALSLMGKCRATMRLPLIEPQEATKRKIEEAMAELALEAKF